jgi:hypothetical protein
MKLEKKEERCNAKISKNGIWNKNVVERIKVSKWIEKH